MSKKKYISIDCTLCNINEKKISHKKFDKFETDFFELLDKYDFSCDQGMLHLTKKELNKLK